MADFPEKNTSDSHHVLPEGDTGGAVREGSPVENRFPRGWKRWMWIAIALVCGVYVFIPEPTDAIPFLGWLDEGVAIIIFTYALEKLGVQIPLLDRILHRKRNRK